jgi:hypothetical protein
MENQERLPREGMSEWYKNPENMKNGIETKIIRTFGLLKGTPVFSGPETLSLSKM